MELVSNYWREVGIDLRLKQVDRSLQSARARAGKMQMTVWHADRVTDILFPLIGALVGATKRRLGQRVECLGQIL